MAGPRGRPRRILWVRVRILPSMRTGSRGGGGAGRALGILVVLGLLGGGGWWAWDRFLRAPAGDATKAGPAVDAPTPGAVTGVVHRRDTRKGVPGVPVRALRRQGDDWAAALQAETDADGRFVLDGLPPGPYRVRPGSDDKPSSEVSHADVTVESARAADVALDWEPMPDDGTVYVRGTVAFDSGRVPAKFSFRFWDAAGGDFGRYAVEGEEGRFGRRLPRAGAYSVTAMTVDGEPHEYFFREVKVTAEQPLDLVVEESREIGVIVYDAATRQPVEGARIYRRDPRDRATSTHPHAPPGPETLAGAPLLTGATGRASLGRGRGTEVFWVVAGGYAWSRASVARGTTEDARVDLKPGGSLRIRVPGWGGLEDPHLSAWIVREGQSEDDELGLPMALPGPVANEEVLVEGLLAGRYLLRVHTGPWLQHLVVHGRVGVTVVPGDPFAVTVPLGAPR